MMSHRSLRACRMILKGPRPPLLRRNGIDTSCFLLLRRFEGGSHIADRPILLNLRDQVRKDRPLREHACNVHVVLIDGDHGDGLAEWKIVVFKVPSILIRSGVPASSSVR